jgi:NAD(P)-dependent dehydrogenase (short-subunit alcohol dehydrogenase family)
VTRVVLTGAHGGVGTLARALFEERGARVVGIDLRPGPGVLEGDVRDAASVQAAVGEAARRLGGIDVLVNNAGIAAPVDTGALPDATVQAIFEVNLLGAWRTTAAALPSLVASGGRVVNVASGLSFANLPLAGAYCASKRALAAYSDVLRLDHGGAISVTTVYPMYMKTGLHVPGDQAGIRLEGILRQESVEDGARAIVRAALGRKVRDVATTRLGWVELMVARHAPALADRIITWRVKRAIGRGDVPARGVAAAVVAHLSG